MINIDAFLITLTFIPYDNWPTIRLVCNDWNEAIVSFCSQTRVLNLANGFADDQKIPISQVFNILKYTFESHNSSNTLALKLLSYKNWSPAFRRNAFFRCSFYFDNNFETMGKPLLDLFTSMEELVINSSLYEAIFDRPQYGMLNLDRVSNLRTLTIINHVLDKTRIRKLPSSIRHLNFVGVTVLSRPFLKSAVRFLKSISFRYFVGEEKTIRDFTPDHITLDFQNQLGVTQWPTDHDQVIEFAEEMNQKYSIQIHNTPVGGYIGPNLAFYACLEGIDFQSDQPLYNSTEENHRLLDYCFLEKYFPIEIEHLFFLASNCCTHNRLFYLLHVAQNTGQIERLKKQGTIYLHDSSYLLKLFETDSQAALKVINEFGFDPNLTTNNEQTMCSVDHVSPLLFQFFLVNTISSPDYLDQYSDAINDPELSFDFSLQYKGISMSRWAMAFGHEKLMKHCLKHGSFLHRELDYDSIKDAAPIDASLETPFDQLKIWIKYESPHITWKALENNPNAVEILASWVHINDPEFISNLTHVAAQLDKSLIDVLRLKAKNSSYDSDDPDSVPYTSFFEKLWNSIRDFCKNPLSSQIIAWIQEEESKDPEKGQKLSQRLLGTDHKFHDGRYMAHVFADIDRSGFGILLFLEALKQMPSLDEPDFDGTPTVFHHISLNMFTEISKWTLETTSNEKISEEDKKLASSIRQVLFTPGQDGLYPIDPYHLIKHAYLCPQIPNIRKLLNEKNHLGLTPTQVACLEGTFSSFKREVELNLDSFSDNLWEELLCPIPDPDDPQIKYPLFALSMPFTDWCLNDSLFDLFLHCADFSLLKPNNASLIHMFSLEKGKLEYFRKVLDRCLEANINIDLQTKPQKKTALHLVAEENGFNKFKLLIERGADATGVKDATGRSAFSHASVSQKISYIEYLKQGQDTEPKIHGENAFNITYHVTLDLVRDMIDEKDEKISMTVAELQNILKFTISDISDTEITYYDVYHKSNSPFSHTMESLDHELSEHQSQGFVNHRQVIRMDLFSWNIYLGNNRMLEILLDSIPRQLFPIEHIDQSKVCRLLWRRLWALCLDLSIQRKQNSGETHRSKSISTEGFRRNSSSKKSPNKKLFPLELKPSTENWKNRIIQETATRPSFNGNDSNSLEDVDEHKDAFPLYFGSWVSMLHDLLDIPIEKILFTYDDLDLDNLTYFVNNCSYNIQHNNNHRSNNDENNNNSDNNNNNNYEENQKSINILRQDFSSIFCNKMTTMHLLFILENPKSLKQLFTKDYSQIPLHKLSHEPRDEWNRTPLDMIDLPFAASHGSIEEKEEDSFSQLKKLYRSNFNHSKKKRKSSANDNLSKDHQKKRKKKKLNHSSEIGEGKMNKNEHNNYDNDIIDISSQQFKDKKEMRLKTRIKDLRYYLKLNQIDFRSNERKTALVNKAWRYYSC